MNINHCHNVADFRRLAKRRIPEPLFHYIDGGADDEDTLARNTDAFAGYELLPRYLVDVAEIDMTTRVLGADLAWPGVLAPTGMTELFHHEGERAAAAAAESHGLMYSLSTMGTVSIEDVAAASAGPKMFQIYVFKDRGLTSEFTARCQAAGYTALCLTIDVPVAGNRERDLVTGMTMPPKFTPKSLYQFATRPLWVMNYFRSGGVELANVVDRVGHGPALPVIDYINSQFDPTVTWDDVGEVIAAWNGPFAIKGILSVADAERAAAVGASAVIVSNHGGRQLDGSVAPVDLIEPIREAVGDRLEVILDGGIRRGTHILKGLALGADAVMFGRPYLFGIGAGGRAGVEAVLTQLRDELERDMRLAGVNRIADIQRGLVQRRST
jgi:L-lactate dehydrogenase (cytochrome)